MREGSLEAPTRHALDWQNPEFWDEATLEEEMERVFDICHGCRRCFNLCDSFPRLFDLIDNGPTGELDGVKQEDFAQVVEACTLCDMCFMTKCPYVPPHEFDLDFPHLMLRHRAVAGAARRASTFVERQLAETDRNGKLGTFVAGLANWATDERNTPTRRTHGERSPASITARACRATPARPSRPRARASGVELNRDGAGLRQAQGRALRHLLRQLQQHRHRRGRARACWPRTASRPRSSIPPAAACPSSSWATSRRWPPRRARCRAALLPWVDKGYDVVALTPSCALMLKFEWPLILPEDPAVERLSQATFDISRVRRRHRQEGRPGARAGSRSRAASACISPATRARRTWAPRRPRCCGWCPKTRVAVIERCSGHGGIWGARTENFETAVKVGKPARARRRCKNDTSFVASECPLAADHLMQVMEMTAGEEKPSPRAPTSDRALRPRLRADGAAAMTAPRKIETAGHPAAGRLRAARAERRTRRSRAQEEPPARGRPVRDVLLRDPTTPCCTRCTRCCSSRRAARRRSPTSSPPTIR